MTSAPMSTAAAAAQFIVVLTILPPPTASAIPAILEQKARPVQKTTTMWSPSESGRGSRLVQGVRSTSIAPAGDVTEYAEIDRVTTAQEKIAGELRAWGLLGENWDGEGAAAPNAQSIKEAVSFVRMLIEDDQLPEPMLHASGHAGLFWKSEDVYADIEFLGDGRIAYYIERSGDKHKGAVKFDSKKMPPVFPTLLRT